MKRTEAREGCARELQRAIRAKCLECCGGMRGEVRGCRITGCALWPYRMAGAEAVAAPPARETGIDGQMNIAELWGEAIV